MTGPTSVRAFLGLGGNLGRPARTMAAALAALDAHADVRVARVSSLYRTPPWGMADQPSFLNAAAEVETSLSARRLLQLCLETELALKRERRVRWGPRSIDIDVLIYGEERIFEEDLEIPHPRIRERAFVLVPLAEIAPGLVLEGGPVEEHLARLDISGVERVSADGAWWRGEVGSL